MTSSEQYKRQIMNDLAGGNVMPLLTRQNNIKLSMILLSDHPMMNVVNYSVRR
jgi:hypothetical protein